MQCTGDAVNSSRGVTRSVPKKPQRPDSWGTPGPARLGGACSRAGRCVSPTRAKTTENVGPLLKTQGKVLFQVLKQSILLL